MGLFDAAAADYERARSLDPENPKVAKELPQVAQARKAQEQGRKSFDSAVAALESGDAANAKRLFGQAHFNLGNALKAAPDSPDNLEMDARVSSASPVFRFDHREFACATKKLDSRCVCRHRPCYTPACMRM